MRSSDLLNEGSVYTRAELRERFDIKDATLNTGVFRPPDHDSVWLFVTKDKTPDRTQYVDDLDGDVLRWQGQTQGRSDRVIIDHEYLGLELLVFYRERKYSHPGAGFVYEGRFRYESHSGSHPTSFVLRRLT